MTDSYRIPVIVGVGQINDRTSEGDRLPGVLDLMETALNRADQDAGPGWLADADFIGIENQISSEVAAWPGTEPITPYLLERLAITPAATLLTEQPSGDGPVYLLNAAANAIATGAVRIAALVGAEALRTAAHRARLAGPGGGAKRSTMQDLLDGSVRPILQKYGLLTPTDVYPLYESASRAAWGQTLDQAQDETAHIWSMFSQVAAENSHAAIRESVSPAAIRTVDAANRMISFPYTKLMVANSAVNQGAALLVTSLGLARERGVPSDRIVFIGAGASAHEDEDILARDSYARSPAMAASISGALSRSGISSDQIELVELYSCFPCVVKMARRELGWPLDRPASVYGGLTFGGGPIGNCMMHAAAAMTEKLRGRAAKGLIFANGGFATHNHTIILSGEAFSHGVPGQDFSVQSDADKLREPSPALAEKYEGPGKIEALSIPYGRDGKPLFATIVGRTPAGQRFLARVPQDDEAGLARLVSGRFEPVGTSGRAEAQADGYAYWKVD